MKHPTSSDVTQLLRAWRHGDSSALDRLMPLVYEELHRIAEGYLRRERISHTLEATAVIHEAYLHLVEKTHPNWAGRIHFFAVAAQLMRRILVDHARSRQTAKRGGDAIRVPLEEGATASKQGLPLLDLIALDEAMTRLGEFDARKSQVIELRYFGGLTVAETAELLTVSPETVHLDTRLAKAWLYNSLRRQEEL